MIEAINLTKKFDKYAAVNNVNFKIEQGTIYGLVGSNGSGKSTLLRLISGVYTQDEGKIIVDNMRVFDNPELKSKICYLGDTPYFIHMSNLNEMERFYMSMFPSFSKERFESLLNVFPLDRTKRISTMSKGMARQAALILSLSVMPKYLLLDEAFDGLDPVMRKVLKSILSDGISDGMTAIIASHNLRDLDELCDSVGVLHKGSLLLSDGIDQLKNKLHKVHIVFKDVPDMSVFNELDVLKTEKTGSLYRLVIRGEESKISSFLNFLPTSYAEILPPTLEEIFMYELEAKGYEAENLLK